MDAVVGLLEGPRARGAFLLRSMLAPPWALRVADRAPLTLLAVVHGEAWVVPDDGEAVRIGPGAAALVRGEEPYKVSDSPQTEPSVIIHPGQRCETPDGAEVTLLRELGVRSWGNDPDGPTTLLTGVYEDAGEVGGQVLRALPRVATVTREEIDAPLIGLLADEVARDAPGQDAVLDRLLDLLLIAALRAWMARPEARAPAWYVAHSDPVVGPALRLMEREPAQPWTVGSLAEAVGLSRSAFARRFRELVGESPMAFLTGCRLRLAADLLRDPAETIGAVAHQVGYGSPFALSAAFKRVHGQSPSEYRAAARRQPQAVGLLAAGP